MSNILPHSANELNLRKDDHLTMAAHSQTAVVDSRFYYEPMLTGHPQNYKGLNFLGAHFGFPLWISSMTGGAAKAHHINRNMARACAEFELGMGLGSCRPLLMDQSWDDFMVADLMPGRPLYANLGIAQMEELYQKKEFHKVHQMVEKLKATGLIIHVNPLQEWFQPGGDVFQLSPLETISAFVASAPYPVIVKEVGHGMGPASLKALMQLPLAAIEFAAFGGTNFSYLEHQRGSDETASALAYVGHGPLEMVGFAQKIMNEDAVKCTAFIISGGMKDSLDGYNCVSRLPGSVFGMAYGVLKHAQGDYSELRQFITKMKDQYVMAQHFLRPKPSSEVKA